MTVTAGPSTAGGGLDTVPALADGLELLGTMPGSGYREPPALVRRSDGQILQLTPLLYAVLAAIDGVRGYDDIAAHASVSYGRGIGADDARMLVDSKLRPLGVVCRADGSQPEVRKANPLLALRFRYVVSDPAVTRRITAPFAWLFTPLIVAAVVVAFVAVCKWVLFDRGLGFAAHEAFARPGLLLTVFAITLVSAGFHEFGHAAAARYGGATPGAMGAGLYLVWPAFYTDVTDSYRLGRGGRIRTDLGGLYFNALLSVVVFGVWWVTGWDALLLVIATQLIQMIRQLPPMVRFDGYHLLADITGVPDLFHRIKPTLVGLWPTKWRSPEARALKPWARIVVTLWVLLIVPLLMLTVLVTVLTLPRIVATAAVSLQLQWRQMTAQFGAGDVLGGLVKVLAVIAVALPIFGIAYMLTRAVTQLARKVRRATEGRPGRRALAGAVAAAVLAALVAAWWPRGNYRPIQSYERGTIQQLLPASFTGDSAGLQEGRQASAQTIWPKDAGPLPSAAHPALSLVLVPRTKTPDGKTAPTWVFPFNRPAPPGVGDNQTLAVNTTDGTVVYDVAFAMVWADTNRVLNKNEAYAFASCTGCRATAVSFQVVLIVGQAHVVVPQNISAAVGYDCIACVTQALAVQLVVNVPAHPSAALTTDLAALWREIQAFSRQLAGMSFSEIHDQLVSYEARILAVIKQDSPAVPGAGPAPSDSPGVSAPAGAGTSAGDQGGAPAGGVDSGAPATGATDGASAPATDAATSPVASTSVGSPLPSVGPTP